MGARCRLAGWHWMDTADSLRTRQLLFLQLIQGAVVLTKTVPFQVKQELNRIESNPLWNSLIVHTAYTPLHVMDRNDGICRVSRSRR